MTDSLARDRLLLYAAAFTRATATGIVGVVAGLHLARAGLDSRAIGFAIAAGLAGMTVAMLVATLGADRLGRRRSLAALGLLGAAGTWGFALGSDAALLAAAAFVGMINGMGRDRGAALVIETAILPATAPDARRTAVFARYNVAQDVGHALGALLAGLPAMLPAAANADPQSPLRSALAIAAALSLVGGVLGAALSPAAEQGRAVALRVSPATRRPLARITALFFVDSLGGGFLTTAGLSLIFAARFGITETTLGPLFAAARVLNALSHFGAAWLAGRIGLVNTMVFTHLPSSLLLATVAVVPSFPVAAALFLLREGLVEMDVPTRQSYVMAMVRPEERAVASGVTSLVRTGAWAIGPAIAGLTMQGLSMVAPLFVGAGLKIAYDLALWRSFRHLPPPEEVRPPA